MREGTCYDCPARIALKAKRCVACSLANRIKAARQRAVDKKSRAIKPIPTPQDIWDKRMADAGVRKIVK